MLLDQVMVNTCVYRISLDRGWLLPRGSYENWSVFNIFVSCGESGAPGAGVPYSFCALPGRYIAEACEQAVRHCQSGDALVLSPAIELSPAELQPLLAAIHHSRTVEAQWDVTVLATRNGEILGYLWSAEALSWLRRDAEAADAGLATQRWEQMPTASSLFAFRFLSGIDAALDMALLQRMGWRTRLLRCGGGLDGPWKPALPSFPNAVQVARLIAARWLSASETGDAEVWAFMPHHAGDVLLVADILRSTPCGVKGLIVNRRYQAIASRLVPNLPLLLLDPDPPSLGRFAASGHPMNDEARYLEEAVLPNLPPNVVPVWLRPLRGYQEAASTVSAQLAFVLSSPRGMWRWPLAPAAKPAEPIATLQQRQHEGLRVLLHLDGGWPLKVVGNDWIEEILARFAQQGWSASILSDRALPTSAPVYRFKDLDTLDRLLDAHDVLVGADSFPVHYANIHREMPTICLFGPTSLRNLASARPNYRALSAGFDCSPCGARALCPRYGGEVCRNFAMPAEVIALLEGGR